MRRIACVSVTLLLAALSFRLPADAGPLEQSGWQVANADQTGIQIALSCVSPTWCMSVGDGGVQIWNGTGWKTSTSSLGKAFQARDVSCRTRRDCLVVGWAPQSTSVADDGGRPVAMHWNGTSWRRVRAPRRRTGDTSFNSVSCPSTTTCVIVGDLANRAFRWREGAWRSQRLPRPRAANWIHAYAVDCPTLSSCHAIGEIGYPTPPPIPKYALLTWNGRSWTEKMLSGVYLSSISCATARSCVAVGSDAAHMIGYAWNGSTWRKSVVPDSPNKNDNAEQEPNGYERLTSVSCWAATGCQAVGVTNTAPFHRLWNGTIWSALANPGSTDSVAGSGQASYDVNDLDCSDASFCLTAGNVTYATAVGQTYMERYRP